MVTVSETAKELLQSLSHPAGTVVRLEPVEGQERMGLVTGQPEQDDQVVERDGADVLHIAAPIADALDGATIDTVETPEGTRLSMTPPV